MVVFHIASGSGAIGALGPLKWVKMKIAFFQGGHYSHLCEENCWGVGLFQLQKVVMWFFFFLNVLLTLHEQVYFIDSSALNMEGWVEISGRSEGKVWC